MIYSATIPAQLAQIVLLARALRMDAVALSRQSESSLVALALRGQPDAYGELVRRHQTAVYNIAYRLVGDKQDAQDLTQDAFIRAYDALASFDATRPFRPWINRIVTNLALNFLERHRTATVSLEEESTGAESESARAMLDDAPQPENVLIASEQQKRVRDALLSLPAHYRAVIELRHFQELSYEEIAQALALPLSAVKSNLFRARQLLKKNLDQY